MDILLIAPKASNLTYQVPELRAVLQSDYRVTPLVGNVTIGDIVAAFVRNYDIVWFIGHSDETGITLSDGKLLVADLAPLAKNSRLLILNSCESVEVAGKIRDATSLDVIAYLGEAEDRSAFRFGATFIQNLKRYGNNFKKAFDESVMSSDTDYVFLRSGRWALMVDDLTKAMFELKTEIALLTQRMTTVERALEVALKQMPERTPSEGVLRVIAIVLILIAILIGVGIYVLAG